ncbi:hypothetical protein ACMCNP_08290 [Candidatus Acidulodesulfobacterium sp. H_13]|uniref:hypothetical protein n=1 Tax=Candidatus Acidulodesulfobacterium sp. H_13 TaxID=3395470 RepID=UPI003AF9EA35
MGWKAYLLVYKAKSPIHIGWHTLGYIELTRYYITGKAMWGAFTANLTRAREENNTEAYQKYGELFKEDVLLSYFYPALDSDIPLLPKFTDKGLEYGECSKSEFESLFIKSYSRTAVLPGSNTAEDESLHESEFIAPCVGDKQSPVYFVGYIFIKDGAKTRDNESVGWDSENVQLKGALSEIFVGGDRKYGWGKLSLVDMGKTREVIDSKFFGIDLILNDTDVKIELNEEQYIPAHLVKDDLKLKGNIEFLVGREWGTIKILKNKSEETHSGFGQKISKAEICWAPGSVMPKQNNLTIGTFGILKGSL